MDTSWLTSAAFKKIGYYHHHGIDVILSSLRTRESGGIGEFYDLLPLIDWCKEVGFDTIQLLPLNDTGKETSPYMARSSCALNPIFLRINGFKSKSGVYQDVLDEKMEALRHQYTRFRPDANYQRFVEQHGWLTAYADTDFLRFVQYLCFVQMGKVKAYANKKGIFLKGDIPILIAEHSVDVLSRPADFDTRFAAGAPPDQYAPEGQYWGFPLYNWEEMQKNGFSWWKERLRYAENFYNIYRLDHIIGFFRIWAIPHGKKATEGFFSPADPVLQEAQGLAILSQLLSTTTMLPIGEDLGFNMGIAQTNMQKLGIPGTKVVRWMRYYNTDRSFIPYNAYPELSLTTVSTHDSEPLGLWWEKQPEEAREFSAFRHSPYEVALSKETRLQILREAHHSASLFHINLLGEYLALFDELVWSNPEEERINIPGLVLPTNWTYCLRPSLEELLAHKGLKKAIRSILAPL